MFNHEVGVSLLVLSLTLQKGSLQRCCQNFQILMKTLIASIQSVECIVVLCSGSLHRSTCQTTPCSGWSASSMRLYPVCCSSRARSALLPISCTSGNALRGSKDMYLIECAK